MFGRFSSRARIAFEEPIVLEVGDAVEQQGEGPGFEAARADRSSRLLI
jgi:hypothetical protein